MRENACFNCKEREIGCHGICPYYAKFIKQLEVERSLKHTEVNKYFEWKSYKDEIQGRFE